MGFNQIHAGPETEHVFEPRRIRGFRSLQDLPDDQVFQAYMLTGDHLQRFSPVCTHEDMVDDRYIQSFAQADVLSDDWLVTHTGTKNTPRLVGWARARIDKVYQNQKPYATLENIFVNHTVRPEPIQEFLLQGLFKNIARRRKAIAGLRIFVQPECVEQTVYFMQRGFRDPAHDDGSGALLWHAK